LFLIDEKNSTEKKLYDIQLQNREISVKLSDISHKFAEKEGEIQKISSEYFKKTQENELLFDKIKVLQENLSLENTSKEKKDAKLLMIEKELFEIKKITALKEVFFL